MNKNNKVVETKSTPNTELFNNLKKNLDQNLTEEEKEKYRKFGEKFYSFDFQNVQEHSDKYDENNNTINIEEALAYIVKSIQAGLHPAFVEEHEEKLLVAQYGQEWYKKFGYTSKTI
jgi:hypothetical protein